MYLLLLQICLKLKIRNDILIFKQDVVDANSLIIKVNKLADF